MKSGEGVGEYEEGRGRSSARKEKKCRCDLTRAIS